MKPLAIVRPGERLEVLCLGAHSDDIEIGAGATILGWIGAGVKLEATWCVVSAAGRRREEACSSAASFLEGASDRRLELWDFEDSLFPAQTRDIKARLIELRRHVSPDLVLTHRSDDAHQDHRVVCELTWNLFRDHLILEYEIPKWDGDLSRPNVYVPASVRTLDRKIEMLQAHFGTQRSKDWFDEATFRGLARLRGMECRAPDGLAEAFGLRKVTLGV